MSKSSDIKAKLEAVRLSYIDSLSEKHVQLKILCSNLNNEWKQKDYDALYLILHSFAGSAETFGFSNLSKISRAIVDSFKTAKKQEQREKIFHEQIANLEKVFAILISKKDK